MNVRNLAWQFEPWQLSRKRPNAAEYYKMNFAWPARATKLWWCRVWNQFCGGRRAQCWFQIRHDQAEIGV